jgi:hypothetical protein
VSGPQGGASAWLEDPDLPLTARRRGPCGRGGDAARMADEEMRERLGERAGLLMDEAFSKLIPRKKPPD